MLLSVFTSGLGRQLYEGFMNSFLNCNIGLGSHADKSKRLLKYPAGTIDRGLNSRSSSYTCLMLGLEDLANKMAGTRGVVRVGSDLGLCRSN